MKDTMIKHIFLSGVLMCAFWGTCLFAQEKSDYLQISGVYPHLATHNQPPDISNDGLRRSHGEAGIGAVVPWAGRLWYITYPQHQVRGSFDKLYEVDEKMNLVIRPESVGGTHASRMIHEESNQLIIGPYFIDADRNVRASDVQKLVGRMTATMRHLQKPESMVYFFDMEGMIYEVDVNTLVVTKLYHKPFPGWHGKGAYTAQGRIVFANNGERPGDPKSGYDQLLVGGPAQHDEEAGALVEWDGKETFNVIERKKFTDVTGPNGIYGSPDDKTPLWAMGWDKNSVILKLLDGGTWSTFRMPKASHAFDHRHGWYTEWPRIREYAPEHLMMIKHAGMYEFPKSFAASNTAGIRPLATHLRYIPDVTHWQGKIILAADEAAMMENPMCGQAQSNLWFGTLDQIKRFGPLAGWGGVWQNDPVEAGVPSDPFLFAGYEQRVLHLKHDAKEPVTFTIEVDAQGKGNWQALRKITVENRYANWVIPADVKGEWVRLTADKNCKATAYFHYLTPRESDAKEQAIFNAMPSVQTENRGAVEGVMRPAARNQSLQWQITSVDGKPANIYYEVEIDPNDPAKLQFVDRKASGATDAEVQFVTDVCKIDNKYVTVLDKAIKLTDAKGREFLVPRGDKGFDELTAGNKIRTVREVQSERWLSNIHGTFYEMPRADDNHTPDFEKMRPVSTHDKLIVDFGSWRGLLVFSGAKKNAAKDGQFFADPEGNGLWFGQIDDLWKLGKPSGKAGIWLNDAVKGGEASLPLLMTNYDKKTVTLANHSDDVVTFRLEFDFDHTGDFVPAFEFDVKPNETRVETLPEGFNAHWLRVVSDKDCTATVSVVYQ